MDAYLHLALDFSRMVLAAKAIIEDMAITGQRIHFFKFCPPDALRYGIGSGDGICFSVAQIKSPPILALVS